MNEVKVIKDTNMPHTIKSLKQDLITLGLKKGMTVIVHTSLKSIGWICGGPVALIQALMEVLTEEGTLVMPTHTTDYSDPSLWQNPPVPNEWVDVIKESMPAFDKDITPTRAMGATVEAFRKWPGVKRSNHPQVSFAAWGKNADYITSIHTLDYGLDMESPLGAIYKLDGYVLLLGVNYNNNTSFHLAEYNIPDKKKFVDGAPIIQDGIRKWTEFNEIELDEDVFNDIGKDYQNTNSVNLNKIGNASSKLFKQRECVDYATKWLLKSKGYK